VFFDNLAHRSARESSRAETVDGEVAGPA